MNKPFSSSFLVSQFTSQFANQFTKHSKCFFAVALLLLLGACATPLKVSQEVLMPAKIDGLKQSKKIAFKKFQGDTGVYTDKIENYFRGITVKGKPYFEIIERQALDTILKEQKMAQSGVISDDDLVKAGNIQGIDTLVTGSIRPPRFNKVKKQEERTDYSQCVQTVYNAKKKRYTCIAFRKYWVSCYDQSVDVQFNIKFVNVERATSNYAKSYQGESQNSYCEDDSSRVLSQSQLEDYAFTQALKKVRQDVAPYQVRVNIEMLDDDDGSELSDQDIAETFDKGMQQIENKNILGGCNSFKQVVARYNQSPAVYYNLGVCSELDADWQKALTLYKTARNHITSEELPQIHKAITRMEKRLLNQKKLQQQSRE